MSTREQYLLRQKTRLERTISEIESGDGNTIRIAGRSNHSVEIPHSEFRDGVIVCMKRYLDATKFELEDLYKQLNEKEFAEVVVEETELNNEERIEDKWA